MTDEFDPNCGCFACVRAERDQLRDVNRDLTEQRDVLLAALKGVIRVADRATVEFDAARAAVATVEGGEG